ncbi:MAG: hypothetical protein U0610_10055 [bacterium]
MLTPLRSSSREPVVAEAARGEAGREPNRLRSDDASYECSLCGDTVSAREWVAHRDLENFVLVEIRRLNPGWIEHDGGCRRCIRAYRLLGRARSTMRRWWRAAA